MTIPGRGLAALLAMAAMTGAGAAGAGGSAGRPLCAAAAGESHAALVVEHGDGSLLRAPGVCVAFGGESIDGEQLLAAAGIQYAAVDFPSVGGRAVCQVDGEPTTPAEGWTQDNCLGHGSYWGIYTAHYHQAFTSSGTGVSDVRLGDGDAEGFHYARDASPPPAAGNACPAPQPRPSPGQGAPVPGATPTPVNRPAQPVGAGVGPTASRPRPARPPGRPVPRPARPARRVPPRRRARSPSSPPGG